MWYYHTQLAVKAKRTEIAPDKGDERLQKSPPFFGPDGWAAAAEWERKQPRPEPDAEFADFVKAEFGHNYFHPESAEWRTFVGLSLAEFLVIVEPILGYQNKRGERLRVRAGITTDTPPNAFAALKDGTHYVGMSLSLIYAMMDIAAYIFSQSTMFPEIGDPTMEWNPRYDLDEVAGFYPARAHLDGVRIDPWSYERRLPRDPVRRHASIGLYLIMARFVWMHELMHCALGHVSFLQSKGADNAIVEISPKTQLVGLGLDGIEARRARSIRHALELEADWHAFRVIFVIEIRGGPNEGIVSWGKSTRLQFTIFGAYLVIWLLEQHQAHLGGHDTGSHPSPAFRAEHMLERMTELAPNFAWFQELLPKWLDLIVKDIPHPVLSYPLGADPIDQAELNRMLAPFKFIPL